MVGMGFSKKLLVFRWLHVCIGAEGGVERTQTRKKERNKKLKKKNTPTP